MPRTMERSALSRTIRELRERRGLSQVQLSEILGEVRTFIGKIENDRRRVYIDETKKFAAALGVTELQFYALLWANEEADLIKEGKKGRS